MDESQILKLIEIAFNQGIPELKKSGLSAEQATEQPFEKDFECGLCFFVIDNPKECFKCEKPACTKCLNDWNAKNKECAFCRQDFSIKPLNRILMNQLNEKIFKCAKCESQLKYANYETHAEKCFLSFKCPN